MVVKVYELLELYQTFKELLIPVFYKFFQKTRKEQKLPRSFYETSVILVPKISKDKAINERIGLFQL